MMALPSNLTLGDGGIRANELVDFYAKERARLEESFTKLLLPAVISIAALLAKDIFASEYFYYAVFLTAFFGSYTALIAIDLYASERALDLAWRVQNAIYSRADQNPSTSLEETLTPDEYEHYVRMETAVGSQRYFMPTGKLVISVCMAATILAIVLIAN